ncbi:glycerophosphoryl diester phosphodiesterase [Acrocarpospora corrugata]|uniref:Glycerophosphoryl diester phosphodiesterase n=1 Tax=Acrocarpospora corrugata TaxID=35763 RepID=A0A5M3WAU6_9ACTN|nr:glycerophosphodiester phosphodiesterase family protein [Acrocarpospora corrugata]GES06165.1 glycerophosphoryl diester phosphodiesterase [Acrocarpospora corrugata]
MYGHVELHGHRGARGLRPENTLPGLAFALELGVDALEFDVTLTADRRLILSHDLTISALTSADTTPASPGDPLFPYVGKPVKSLTQYQIRTLDAGTRRPARPDDRFAATQVPVPDTRMPTLGAVLALVGVYGADHVRLHVELKSDPTRPDLSPDHQLFTELVLAELDRHHRLDTSAILSFDWRILEVAREAVPHRFALVEADTLDPYWLAGFDVRDLGSDLPAAAEAVGATVLSPDHVLIDLPLMTSAALRGLPVVAWTVNEPDEAAELIDLGVAGIVTDYPDRMRELWTARGMPLPAQMRALRQAALT